MRVNSANAASSSDSHRLRRARRSPPRTTRDFHGISRTTAIPQIPWPMATQAPSGEPIATVATPVPKANSSTTSSAWFVWRPGDRSSIRTGLGDGRGSPLRRRITNVIRYVIALWQRARSFNWWRLAGRGALFIQKLVWGKPHPRRPDHPTATGRIPLLPKDCLIGSVVVMNTHRWIAVGLAAVATAAAATTTFTAAATAASAATAPAQHAYGHQDLQRDLDAITATGVPGVLAEVRAGDRQLRGTSGVANLDSRTPVNASGFFRIGSNTKTFISVVVLQLAAEHRLSLDDTVGHWLPGVVHGNGNDGNKITVRELLQHTSGLHNYTDDLQAQITTPEAYRKLDFAPGTAWHYSNTNYILLGMIIEKVTHDSWEDQVTRRIIVPLGLHHTYAPGTSTGLPRPHATGYLFFDKNTRIDTTAENMSWSSSAGALISTAADLTRFWSAIGHGTLLPPAQTREMRRTVPATGGDSASVPGSRYGLGIFFVPLSCGGGYWSHEGDVPGYNTIGAVSSDGRTTAVLSINSNVDDPVLAAEYGLIDHVMCNHRGSS